MRIGKIAVAAGVVCIVTHTLSGGNGKIRSYSHTRIKIHETVFLHSGDTIPMTYLPPTQSQKPNIFSVAMPNAETAFSFVDKATK